VKWSVPLFGVLMLFASACGGTTHSSTVSGHTSTEGGGHSSSVRPVTRRLAVDAKSSQIYVYDPKTQADEEASEAENPLVRAREDAYKSHRFVGYDSGVVDVITPNTGSRRVNMRIEVTRSRPRLQTAGWDQIVEVPLPAPSGRLFVVAAGGGGPAEAKISRGRYRARISGRRTAGGGESYRLQLWPSTNQTRVSIK
jgi:hypothetical protein